jgi:hypothetical protein
VARGAVGVKDLFTGSGIGGENGGSSNDSGGGTGDSTLGNLSNREAEKASSVSDRQADQQATTSPMLGLLQFSCYHRLLNDGTRLMATQGLE